MSFQADGSAFCLMGLLNISHKGVYNSGSGIKNFEEQPLGPHALKFLETCMAALTSSGLCEVHPYVHLYVE